MKNFFSMLIFLLFFNHYSFALESKVQGLGDLYCPNGQHVIGLHEGCHNASCVVNNLYCG